MEIMYSKLKSGPISLFQGRPMITGKHMPGAEFLVIDVFFFFKSIGNVLFH